MYAELESDDNFPQSGRLTENLEVMVHVHVLGNQ